MLALDEVATFTQWSVMAISFLQFAFLVDRFRQGQCFVEALYVIMVEFIGYGLNVAGWYTVNLEDGRTFYIGRYVSWILTSPVLLIIVCNLHAEARIEPRRTLFCSVMFPLMTALGGAAALIEIIWVRVALFLLSCVICGLIFRVVHICRTKSLIVVGGNDTARRLIDRITWLFYVTWCMYPTFVLLGPEFFDVVPAAGVAVWAAVTDLFSKNLFGLLCWFLRWQVIEPRGRRVVGLVKQFSRLNSMLNNVEDTPRPSPHGKHVVLNTGSAFADTPEGVQLTAPSPSPSPRLGSLPPPALPMPSSSHPPPPDLNSVATSDGPKPAPASPSGIGMPGSPPPVQPPSVDIDLTSRPLPPNLFNSPEPFLADGLQDAMNIFGSDRHAAQQQLVRRLNVSGRSLTDDDVDAVATRLAVMLTTHTQRALAPPTRTSHLSLGRDRRSDESDDDSDRDRRDMPRHDNARFRERDRDKGRRRDSRNSGSVGHEPVSSPLNAREYDAFPRPVEEREREAGRRLASPEELRVMWHSARRRGDRCT